MARTKAVLGTGARMADNLSASLLARVYPAEVINEVLDAHGRNSQRVRSFPAVVGMYRGETGSGLKSSQISLFSALTASSQPVAT
jgi:Insertion element 4 transposase N-terminal